LRQLFPLRLRSQNLIFKRDAFRVVLFKPSLSCISVREDLQMIAVANLLGGVNATIVATAMEALTLVREQGLRPGCPTE